MKLDPKNPELGTVYAVPLNGDKSAPGRWSVVQVVALGDCADLGEGAVALGRPWGPTVIGFNAVFDELPNIEDLVSALSANPVSILTVVTFAHSDIHWEILGKVPVPLYGLCRERLNLCICYDVISGLEFHLPYSERRGVYNKSTSTAAVMSDLQIIATEVDPEYSELMKLIADPKHFDHGIVRKLRLLEH